MKMQSSYTSERLQLQLITTADHAFIRELVNTEGWLRFIGDRNVHDETSARAYIEKILNTANLYYWIVRIKENGLPVGLVSFMKRPYLDYYDIGFAFLPDQQQKGFAAEAAGMVLQDAVNRKPEAPVLATTMPANEKSIQLLNRLGLFFEKEIQVDKEILLVFSNAKKE